MRLIRALPMLICLAIVAIFCVHFSSPLAAQSPVKDEKSGNSARREGLITGRVVATDGQPVSEAVVMAMAVGGKMNDFRQVECDDEGNFKLTGLKFGSYMIMATNPGYVSLNNSSGSAVHRVGESVTIQMAKGGVITGRVTDAYGEPLEGVEVNIRMVRDHEGKDVSSYSSMRDMTRFERSTDDRGIYRVFGLYPGAYVASVVDTAAPAGTSGRLLNNSPTFYPSGKRGAATEITIRGNEEVSGIDIRLRDEHGYKISGTLSGNVESGSFFSVFIVFLNNAVTGEMEGMTMVDDASNFALSGVADGVYELMAQRISEAQDFSISAPRRITVKGADVTGIDLKLIKPGSISGRLVVEPLKSDRMGHACQPRQEKFLIEEIILQAKKTDDRDRVNDISFLTLGRNETRHLSPVNENGDFVINHLGAGIYRIISDLPDDNWYLKAVTRTAAKAAKAASNKLVDIMRDGLTIKFGENLSGIEATVAEGAASLRGQVAPANDPQATAGTSLPTRWRVHLVPAEEAAAEDVLRYAETVSGEDGTFELKNLAPGKYLFLARKFSEKDLIGTRSLPLAWDSVERTKLRREAQSLKQEVELQHCQQATYATR